MPERASFIVVNYTSVGFTHGAGGGYLLIRVKESLSCTILCIVFFAVRICPVVTVVLVAVVVVSLDS